MIYNPGKNYCGHRVRQTKLDVSSLYVCMAIKYIIVLFVETPRKFITAVINLRGVSTNKTIIKIDVFLQN